LEDMEKQYERKIETGGAVAGKLIPLRHCVKIAENIRECHLAENSVGVPELVEVSPKSIEDSDNTVPNVNVVNQLTKKDIADGAFDGTRRALARFITQKDETPIEQVHRLRCDDVEWKYIARTIYKEENEKEIAESDLDSEVKRLQKQHRRNYPEFYTE